MDAKIVLVTGVAGFIGSHCALSLLKRGDIVIGIDEVNDYYDVSLKESNIKRVEAQAAKGQFVFYQGDICNKELVERIFSTHKRECAPLLKTLSSMYTPTLKALHAYLKSPADT